MEQWPDDIAAVHDGQDAYRAASKPPMTEAAIRADLRSWVRDLLKYAPRGGRVTPSILNDVRYARRSHTESIGRER